MATFEGTVRNRRVELDEPMDLPRAPAGTVWPRDGDRAATRGSDPAAELPERHQVERTHRIEV